MSTHNNLSIHTGAKDKPASAKRKRKMVKIPEVKPHRQGRWTAEEVSRYNRACELHPKDWGKVAESIGTRTPSQVKSHNQKVEGAKKTEKHSDKRKIFYDFLIRKEMEVIEQVRPVRTPEEPRKLVISKELAKYLEFMFGPILTPYFVLNKQHLKLLGINGMIHSLQSSITMPCNVAESIPQTLEINDNLSNIDPNPSQFGSWSHDSVVIEEERSDGDLPEMEAKNAIEYNISRPDAFMSLSL